MSAPFRIEDSAATHVGNVRSENEDSHLSAPQSGVWLVADGMGGHANGRYASATIAEALEHATIPDGIEDACDAVAGAIHAANATIFGKSVEVGKQMGSTFVSLIMRGTEFAVLWAGDSRAYLYRDGHLYLLTRDHTQVEAMLERGLLTLEQAVDHPMKHVLARAVGVQTHLQIDAIRDTVAARDLFLLCSDGLHSVIDDHEIAAILAEDGSDACDRLIDACLQRGAPDNVTVALVAAREPTVLALNGAFE